MGMVNLPKVRLIAGSKVSDVGSVNRAAGRPPSRLRTLAASWFLPQAVEVPY